MNKFEVLGLALLGVMFFVWPVAHTATARDLLLILNLGLFAYLVWRKQWPRNTFRELSRPALMLAVLTVWMYVVAIFVSHETAWSLSEISSQWWRALAALLAGGLVAMAARENPAFTRAALAVLLSALVVHILYVDYQGVQGLWAPGSLGRMAGLTEGPDKSNYLTNVLLGLLLAELFYRAAYRKRMLPLTNSLFATVLVLAVISVFLERTRNGIITLVLMLLLLCWFYLRERHAQLNKRALSMGIVAMLVIVAGGTALMVSARQSSSLNNLIDTIPIAWDTEHQKAWQGKGSIDWPKLPNGETVDVSLYLRIAWLKEGLLLVRDHPLGVGFGRNAFGHGLKDKYGKGGGHSHSGLLDMAIGLGIPGALLWLGFFVSLATIARRCHRANENYAAVLLLLLLLDYGVRMVLDSVIRDHMLQQFMFLVGLAAVMMTFPGREKGNPRT